MASKNKKIIIGIVFILMITLIGISYAFFTANLSGREITETITLTGGTMDVTFVGGNNIVVSNIIPDNNPAATKVFTVVGNNTTIDLAMPYVLKLIVDENTFSDEAITYTLISENVTNEGVTVSDISNQVALPTSGGEYLLGEGEFIKGVNQIHKYSLNIYFPETGRNQNEDQGKIFKAHIGYEGGELELLVESIVYQPTAPTDELVTVTLTANQEITIANWQCTANICQHNYTENIVEDVKMTAVNGNYKDVTISVSNMIEENLVGAVVLNPATETTGSVTAIITANRDITIPSWQCDANICTKEYSSNVKETVVISDTYGITKNVNININNIVYVFDYTGTYSVFTVPVTGTYKIQLWGSSAIGNFLKRGYGAYVAGEIALEKDAKLYVFVGQKGTIKTTNATYNGGGSAALGTYYVNYGNQYVATIPGGGASDIRYFGPGYTPTTTELQWNNVLGLRNRIMVAAGSSSSTMAGGISSDNSLADPNYNSTWYTLGASQTSAGCTGNPAGNYCGSFGVGGNGENYVYGYGSTGGGGGYYGGSGGPSTDWNGSGSRYNPGYATSGTSFISGHTGCVAILTSSSQLPKTGCSSGTSDNSCSWHYSGMQFSNTAMIDGGGYNWTNIKTILTQMPKPDGSLYASGVGHTGNGYAKISFLE